MKELCISLFRAHSSPLPIVYCTLPSPVFQRYCASHFGYQLTLVTEYSVLKQQMYTYLYVCHYLSVFHHLAVFMDKALPLAEVCNTIRANLGL